MQRINALIDAGTWCPLNSLFNPEGNKFGTTNIINGLGRVNGKWVYIIASDNKKMAGAWVPGQAENLLRCLLYTSGIRVYGLSGCYIEGEHMPESSTVILGYANLTEEEIAAGKMCIRDRPGSEIRPLGGAGNDLRGQ